MMQAVQGADCFLGVRTYKRKLKFKLHMQPVSLSGVVSTPPIRIIKLKEIKAKPICSLRKKKRFEVLLTFLILFISPHGSLNTSDVLWLSSYRTETKSHDMHRRQKITVECLYQIFTVICKSSKYWYRIIASKLMSKAEAVNNFWWPLFFFFFNMYVI